MWLNEHLPGPLESEMSRPVRAKHRLATVDPRVFKPEVFLMRIVRDTIVLGIQLVIADVYIMPSQRRRGVRGFPGTRRIRVKSLCVIRTLTSFGSRVGHAKAEPVNQSV